MFKQKGILAIKLLPEQSGGSGDDVGDDDEGDDGRGGNGGYNDWLEIPK